MEKTEIFPGGLTFRAGPGVFPLSTDTMVLGDFVRLPQAARVVDLGSGSGALGLLLCGRYAGCRVTGVELSPAAHQAALDNIARNRLFGRLESLLGDIRQVRQLLPAGEYQCVVSNPPYFSGGRPSSGPAGPQARQETACTLAQVYAAAAWLLPTGGQFCLIHRPERLTDLLALGRQHGLEPKNLRLVRHRAGSAPSLALVRCLRGGKPGLTLEPELVLYRDDGSLTPEGRRIYGR